MLATDLKRAFLIALAASSYVSSTSFAQSNPAAAPAETESKTPPSPASPVPIFSSNGFDLWLNFEAGLQIVGQHQSYWNLSSKFSPGTPFAVSRHWYESYFKPGARFSYAVSSQVSIYGGLAFIGSYTHRQDMFAAGDTGRFLLEQGYAGVKYESADKWLRVDLSAGQQEYRIGTGMLIANGAGNGFERGTLIFGPRRAWQMTAIARVQAGAISADAFVLDANELKSNDTGTRLAGGKVELSLGPNQFAGLSYIKATHSTAPYIQAAPNGVGIPAFVLNGRDGLETLYGYARYNPLSKIAPGFWVGFDAALQRNERINLSSWAGRIEIGNTFVTLPWTPTLSYSFQTFSGDDPKTTRLERFDPLFYDGSPPAWVTGSNASLVIINTNVNAHKFSLQVQPTPKDIVTLRYTHIRANELNSPLQFGQGTRLAISGGVPALAAGVRFAHISDDLLLEYTRIVTPNIFLSFGLAASYPGKGIKDVMMGGHKDWYGGFANLVVKY